MPRWPSGTISAQPGNCTECERHGEGDKNPANFHILIAQFDKYFPPLIRVE